MYVISPWQNGAGREAGCPPRAALSPVQRARALLMEWRGLQMKRPHPAWARCWLLVFRWPPPGCRPGCASKSMWTPMSGSVGPGSVRPRTLKPAHPHRCWTRGGAPFPFPRRARACAHGPRGVRRIAGRRFASSAPKSLQLLLVGVHLRRLFPTHHTLVLGSDAIAVRRSHISAIEPTSTSIFLRTCHLYNVTSAGGSAQSHPGTRFRS